MAGCLSDALVTEPSEWSGISRLPTLRLPRMHTAPPLHMPRHPCLLGNKPAGGLACTWLVFTNSIDYRLLAALKLNYELIIELVLLCLWLIEACTISWQCILPLSISPLQTELWNPSTCQALFGVQTMTDIRIFKFNETKLRRCELHLPGRLLRVIRVRTSRLLCLNCQQHLEGFVADAAEILQIMRQISDGLTHSTFTQLTESVQYLPHYVIRLSTGGGRFYWSLQSCITIHNHK